MYYAILLLHSWLRWIIILLLLLILWKFSFSYYKKIIYTKFDRLISVCLLSFTHLQFLIGLILYFALSPIVKMAWLNISAAMHDRMLRYWSVEHIFSMFIFLSLIQIGFSISKRIVNNRKKHLIMLIFSALACLILIATLPWPWQYFGRVLFRTS